MKRPRILLIGKIGQVGWELRRTLAPLGEAGGGGLSRDRSHRTAARSANGFAETAPDIVLNAAAYTAVDKAETELRPLQPNQRHRARHPGRGGQGTAGRCWCITRRITCSTAPKMRLTWRTDAPNPLSAYGRSKLAGDQAVQACGRQSPDLPALLGLRRARAEFHAHHDAPGARAGEAAGGARSDWLPHLVADDRRSHGPGPQAGAGCGPAGAFNGVITLPARGTPAGTALPKPSCASCPRRVEVHHGRTHHHGGLPVAGAAAGLLRAVLRQAWSAPFGLRLPDWEESLKQVLE